MPRNIIINSSNYNPINNNFRYYLPVEQKFSNQEVALSYISLYNSFYNTSSAYGNNQVTIAFPVGATMVSQTLTIPDSYNAISDLNYQLQQFMISQGWYLIDTATGANVYFISLQTNSTQYKAQFTFSIVPTSRTGYTVPSNATAIPTITSTPTITFNTGFGSLIGFSASTLPAITSSNQSVVSTLTPDISVVNSLILTTNIIHHVGLSIPCNVFTAIALTSGFGSLITNNNSSLVYSDIAQNSYQYIEIKFYDQNLNALTLIDLDVLIILTIKDKKEV